MEAYFQLFINFLKTFPFYQLMAVPSAILLLVVMVIVKKIVSRLLLISRLKRVLKHPELTDIKIRSKYSKRHLLKRSHMIEKFESKTKSGIIVQIGLDDIWIENLINKKGKKDFVRVLKHAPEKGLFECFKMSLKKKEFAPLLMDWFDETGDLFYLRKIANFVNGETFNGYDAYEIFRGRITELREMTGDPEWTSRYFSIKILVHDDDKKSIRAVWNALKDSYPIVRRIVIDEFSTEENERFYKELFSITISDPIFEIRKASWERIQKDFIKFYVLKPDELSEEEVLHVIELLRPNSKDDENFALIYLKSPNLELRFSAASYLDRNKVLERLCLDVDLGDKEVLNRNYFLLEKASQVNVTSFLSIIERTYNPATLLICAKILRMNGNRYYVTTLAKKVFVLFRGNIDSFELYKLTLDCISKRGNEEALKLLDRELNRRKNEKEIMEIILPAIPRRGDYIFINSLIPLLKEPKFEPKEALRDVFKRIPIPLVLPVIFEIINSEKKAYPLTVRVEALRLLGEMKMFYCLQIIMENLPMLSIHEAKEFAAIFSEYPRALFISKVENLLGKHDAKIRASVISILPFIGEKKFINNLKDSIKDADPEVRIASVWALVDFKEQKLLNEALSMLRDPVEKVREEVAIALGTNGSDAILEKLKNVLFDENEVLPVKKAVIRGLGSSISLKSIDILIKRLDVEEELVNEIVTALSEKVKKEEIEKIIDNFKDSGLKLKEKITLIFKEMGENGEERLADLLRENQISLNNYIVEILEETGYIESEIRKLVHKNPLIRREAAEMLSIVGTESAFKGIVLAARDPDSEVRIKVTKALERLETAKGEKILNSLKNDPDKRIRKYTLWALERLKAKAL